MSFYPPAPRYAFHPYIPERLGFRRLLKLTNPELAQLLTDTDRNTLVIARSRTTLYREGMDVLRRNVPGNFVELGVHKGGSAAVLAHVIKDDPSRHLHLFDRWGDLPEPTDQDGFRKEQYRKDKIPEKLAILPQTLHDTRHVVEEVIKFPKERLHYHQGWIPEILSDYPGGPIAFASVDCDYYESVKPTLAFLEEHLSPGAVIIIDDYGTWPGARLATHEWLETTRRKVSMHVLRRMGNAILRVQD